MSKIALITGATSGIGRATVLALAELWLKSSWDFVITGRRQEKLDELALVIQNKYGRKVKSLRFDVRNKEECETAWNSLPEDWQNIDLLINNAGLARGFDPIHSGDTDDWNEMIDTNIKGLLYMTRLISPGMVERQEGQIINVCSTAGHETYPKGNVYSATKHAVDALTKGMRLDLYKHGIRVGQVSPAHVEETEFALVRFSGDAKKASIYQDFTPLKSSDVADSISFMATRPKHVNVQDITLMGTQQASNNHIDKSGRKYE